MTAKVLRSFNIFSEDLEQTVDSEIDELVYRLYDITDAIASLRKYRFGIAGALVTVLPRLLTSAAAASSDKRSRKMIDRFIQAGGVDDVMMSLAGHSLVKGEPVEAAKNVLEEVSEILEELSHLRKQSTPQYLALLEESSFRQALITIRVFLTDSKKGLFKAEPPTQKMLGVAFETINEQIHDAESTARN